MVLDYNHCVFKTRPNIYTRVFTLRCRLDFNEFEIGGAANTGACNTDTFVVTGQTGKNPPTVCGTLSGQHSKILERI